LASMDSPSGDGINTYLVSKVTREAGVTVALSGLGGDELFAGYAGFTRWHRLKKNQWLWNIPQLLRAPAGNLAEWYIGDSRGGRFNDIVSAKSARLEDMYPSFRQIFEQSKLKNLLPPSMKPADTIIHGLLKDRSAAIQKLPFLSQMTVGELLSYTLNVLLKDTDQMSMASALEIREPFFDYKLIEYAMQIPDQFKYPKFQKSLFVEAMSPLLPDEIVHRPKKGFTLPWDYWIRNEMHNFCDQRLNALKDRNLLNPDAITQIWKDYLARDKKAMPWIAIWYLVSLEDWLYRNQITH
jgi:asparagine synthase (glutamine-hydrolysing)